jgi:hypothetical protein
VSRVRASRRTSPALRLASVLALACAAALWALAGGRGPRNGEPTAGPDGTGLAARDAGPAAAVPHQPAATPDAAPAPLVPQADGTQILDGIPCQVRQPDGSMSSRPVRITIQPAAVLPVEGVPIEGVRVESGGTAPGHK